MREDAYLAWLGGGKGAASERGLCAHACAAGTACAHTTEALNGACRGRMDLKL